MSSSIIKFAIITHVNHIQNEMKFFGYAPYTREMNIWLKYVDELIVVAPLKHNNPSVIDHFYQHHIIDFRKVPDFNVTSLKNIFFSVFKLPIIFWQIFKAMKNANHIHLRCPGNIGLIGCVVQMFFPHKIKTAKYAGNWDPGSKQPWTYKLQKYILSNTFLTRNMQVLVYGEWENQTSNIKPFFTATYSENEKKVVIKENFKTKIQFVFVGSLVSGKNPMYAIQLIEKLKNKGKNVVLNVYGNGTESTVLEGYIKTHQLENTIFLHGNQNQEIVKKAYQKSHFVLLPSKSEGWPKAIAEGMFWGCVPVATKVSCVPYMLDFGNRGILLEMNLDKDVLQLEKIVEDEKIFMILSELAKDWSQIYTTDVFETEIKKLLEKR
ncbi:glycosyltransferase [Flavobacterium sp. Fl-77]|uniref:Glycosyltransferase n=2 Tax=Flavobacterium flavipigmentatum TaxID=2893884 RepID=A0AAJ2SEZ4_9FLAO|nr:glycosyltransferase [Flavobacterium sp. Fl-33]MDX6185840.1 glycosyltransferase [Flavobacterium sp. Fl-77]